MFINYARAIFRPHKVLVGGRWDECDYNFLNKPPRVNFVFNRNYLAEDLDVLGGRICFLGL